MSELTALVVVGLGAWRLAMMLTVEEGPWALFERLRLFAGVPEQGEIEPGSRAKLFTCPWCMSVWTAPPVFALWWFAPWAAVALAAMAVAVVVDRYVR